MAYGHWHAELLHVLVCFIVLLTARLTRLVLKSTFSCHMCVFGMCSLAKLALMLTRHDPPFCAEARQQFPTALGRQCGNSTVCKAGAWLGRARLASSSAAKISSCSLSWPGAMASMPSGASRKPCSYSSHDSQSAFVRPQPPLAEVVQPRYWPTCFNCQDTFALQSLS